MKIVNQSSTRLAFIEMPVEDECRRIVVVDENSLDDPNSNASNLINDKGGQLLCSALELEGIVDRQDK